MKTNRQWMLIADWTAKHNKNLKPLYKDFCKEKQNKAITFFEFATFMYSQCKHPKK